MQRLILLLLVLLWSVPASATLAFDASSTAMQSTDALSWTHTPSGTPDAVIVQVVQHGNGTDQVTGCTYGGTAMTEAAESPVLNATAEPGAVYTYVLLSSVPTGAQTVACASTLGTKQGVAVTITADGTVSVEDTATLASASQDEPTATLSTGASVATFVMGALHRAEGTPTDLAPGSDYTQILEHDFGPGLGSWVYRTMNATGGSVSVDWVTGAVDDAAIHAIALKETIAASGGGTSRSLTGAGR